jgi:serine/threonine-protein kinase
MKTGKLILICILTSGITSAATTLLMRKLQQRGFFEQEAKVSAPMLVGLTEEQARLVLGPMKLLLVVSERREDVSMARGKISSQAPSAGSEMSPGETVRVVVSSGQGRVKVPAMTGLALASAVEVLTSAGLKPGTVTRKPSSTVARDQVLSSFPAAGTMVSSGATVSLVVSLGPQQVQVQVQVPKLVGKRLYRARRLLAKQGLKLGRVRYTYDEDKAGGVVLSQSPAGESPAKKGATVDLVVNESD